MLTANMKHKYRLVAIDMDGTLLRHDKTIGERSVRAVNTALQQGTEVLLCTGRSRIQFERYMVDFPEMRYAISSSGAVVYDLRADWKKIISNEMPAEVVLKILRYADTVDCFPIMSVAGKTVYTGEMAPLAAEYGLGAYTYELSNFGTGVKSVQSWYRERPQPVESLSLYFRDRSFREDAVEALKDLPLYFALPGEPAVDMSMQTANKGYALTKLCEMLDIPLTAAVAIGDSDNDMPMLRVAGLAVASGNAPEAVKSAVDYVTLDCDHDGVGAAIEQFILNP